MQRFHTVRMLLMALLLAIIPVTTAHAGVFVSVGIAPPVLPVYVQPPCPSPNMIWTPGYWAYGPDGYYWVPGAWVPAPYEGALWTPPYWGWGGGFYAFHAGYWGPHVGYYGGINYGFGYMGVGFVGGEWRGREFAYNTAVVNVNRTYVHNTFINNTIVRDHTIVNNNHIAYNGGPHGIQHEPTPQERNAMHMQHMAPTRFQQQHVQEAQLNRANSFNANHGHPQVVALTRPLAAEHAVAPEKFAGARNGNERSGAIVNRDMGENRNGGKTMQPLNRAHQGNMRENGNARITANPQQQRQQERTMQQQRSLNENGANGKRANQYRPQAQQQTRPETQSRPQQQQNRPQAQPQYRAPQQQNRPQQYRAPQQQSRPQQHADSRPRR
jgi:hypothetical protein